MKEIFRKHGKIIMGGLSIALMFAFGLPSLRPREGDRHSLVVGTVNGKKVTNDDITQASNECTMLDTLFRNSRDLQESEYAKVWAVLLTMPKDEEKSRYWLMLKTDASKYGASVFSEESATSFASSWNLQPYLPRDYPAPALASLLSHLDTVRNYLNFIATPPRPVTELELIADKMQRKLQVSYVMLDGEKDWEQIGEPTKAQLEAQFNAYKGVIRTPILAGDMPGVLPPADKDGHHFPFGYKYPDRAVVEYVVFERGEIRARIKGDLQKAMEEAKKGLEAARGPVIGQLKASNPQYVAAVAKEAAAQAALQAAKASNAAADVVAARAKELADADAEIAKFELPLLTRDAGYLKAQDAMIDAMAPQLAANDFYNKHPEQFRKAASAVDIASTQSAAPAVIPWEEVKEKVIDEQVVEPRVTRQIKLMTDLFLDKSSKTEKADYAALVKELSKSTEFNGYVPKVATTGPKLLSGEQLAAVPGIGGAFYFMESRGVEFPLASKDPGKPSLATSVEELGKLEAQNPLASLKLKSGVDGPLLTDAEKNSYVYRVTSTEKSREPTSVEEGDVAAQVTADFKKLENFKKREQQMKELAKLAEGKDLESLAGQQKLTVAKPGEFTQLTANGYRNITLEEAAFTKELAKYTPDQLAILATQIEQQKGVLKDQKARINFDQVKDIVGIRDFAETSFALANKVGPAGGESKGTTELRDEAALKCYVIQLLKVTPATGKDFGDGRVTFFRLPDQDVGTIDLRTGVNGKFLTDYLGEKALEARVAWKAK